MAYDRARDKRLRAIDAKHLFEPNTIHIGIRRNHYLRGYTYAFIEMFSANLKRTIVEKAIKASATRSAVKASASANK
jgi:LysR family cys regulon transcriptional activator